MLGGRAAADVSRSDDHHRLTLHPGRFPVCAVDGGVIVTVDREHLPAVAFKTLFRVVCHRQRGVALDGDVVGVVDQNQIVELHRPGPGAHLVADALLEVAVAAEDPGLVAGLHLLGGKREPRRHGDALAERTGGDFHPRHQPALGVTRAAAAELTEGFKLIHRKTARSGKMKQRVDERAGVAAGEHKAVTRRPCRIARIDIQILQPKHRGEIGHSERSAGVTGVRLVDHIRTEAANRIRRQLQFSISDFHIRVLYQNSR